MREISSMQVEIFCFILYSILLTRWRNKTPLSHVRIYDTKRSRAPPPLQSTICSYAPVSIFAIEYYEYEYYENFIYTVC